jgi:hypothetical protein
MPHLGQRLFELDCLAYLSHQTDKFPFDLYRIVYSCHISMQVTLLGFFPPRHQTHSSVLNYARNKYI